MSDEQQPKLIIDDDWKAEAQKEKQRKADEAAAKTADSAGQQGGEQIEANFDELVRMLVMQALLYLGAMPDPATGKAVVSLEYAKLNIDLLGILEEKTKGNLTEEEQQVLSQTASELRLQFVEVSKAVEKAIAEGKIKPMDVGAGGMMPGGMPPTGPAGT